MALKRILRRLLPSTKLEHLRDLDGWRRYSIELVLFFALIAMPVGVSFAIPTYIAEGRWGLILFDILIFAIILLALLFRNSIPFIKTFFLLLYGMILIFILFLGPFYARPAWLVLGVVSAAFLFGVRAAIATTIINVLLLTGLYFYAGPSLPAWQAVYDDPLSKWIMFCANLSLVSLIAGLPVGFLLNRMNTLLKQEQALGRQLARESHDLQSANRRLKDEIAEHNRAEAEKERLKLELSQAQKMEAMGTLAGGIAHDFNNILSAIIGYSQLALTDTSDPEQTRQKVTEILKAGERARALVRQILAFSRKAEITIAPLDLTETVTEALKMMRALIPANIRLHTNLAQSCVTQSSSTHIHQILMNLCNNAIHAMGADGGTLDVSLARETLTEETARPLNLTPDRYIKLTVRDTGRGMPPEIAKRVFEPYFTTKERGSGTGLGLSVAHGIATSQGGSITCRSTPGSGTTFDIYLPEIQTDLKLVKDSEDHKMPTGTETILYVDDEATLVDVASQMLMRLGYKVVTRTSSIEALKLFSENPGRFDAVITDMTMPQLTGDRLAQEMLMIRADTPIIMCTGYSDHVSSEAAAHIGIREFLMKPYDMPQLARALRQAIDGGAPRGQ
ncbi:MAG: ATP-binding protein [Smithellaceae bacterium]